MVNPILIGAGLLLVGGLAFALMPRKPMSNDQTAARKQKAAETVERSVIKQPVSPQMVQREETITAPQPTATAAGNIPTDKFPPALPRGVYKSAGDARKWVTDTYNERLKQIASLRLSPTAERGAKQAAQNWYKRVATGTWDRTAGWWRK